MTATHLPEARDVVLATLNARYIHASVGLRCLHANLGDHADRTVLVERLSNDRPADVVEAIAAFRPRVVGLGVYIWNVEPMLDVVRLLRVALPEVVIVLGGPEVSHEPEDQAIVAEADYVVAGEGEVAFATLVSALLNGERPETHTIAGGTPPLETLQLPYDRYDDDDIRHRHLYIEASRGCPYRCEFCLSALDRAVRPFDQDALLAALDRLITRGARNFRFVDRTFNLDVASATRLLTFFRDRWTDGMFLHFEMVPDRFPEALREAVQGFPAGGIQFEVGIQTFDPEVSRRISRPLKVGRVEENLGWLINETDVHLHTDLIVGLPGEGLEAFGRGFDQLLSLRPHEIQVGILKRLRGAPIARHEAAFGLVFDQRPPYEVVRTNDLSFAELQRLKRFAKVWDMVANRGLFPQSLPRVLEVRESGFWSILDFTDWLFERDGAVHSLALLRLAEALLAWATARGVADDAFREGLVADYSEDGRRRPSATLLGRDPTARRRRSDRASRQRRHADA